MKTESELSATVKAQLMVVFDYCQQQGLSPVDALSRLTIEIRDLEKALVPAFLPPLTQAEYRELKTDEPELEHYVGVVKAYRTRTGCALGHAKTMVDQAREVIKLTTR